MAGLDKIIERIAQDSAAKCDGIIFDAQSEASKIKDAAARQAEEEKAAVVEAAGREARTLVDMAESGSELETRKLLLGARVEIINKAIDVAFKKLGAMPDDEYFAALYALAIKYSQSGEGVMYLSQKDLGRMPSDFEENLKKALAAKGAECILSEKPENIASGIFLDYGNIAIDCSFESVIEEKSDIYKEKISEIIF